MNRKWKCFTAKFALNDSDDEILRGEEHDDLEVDLNTVTAFYPSKYEGFIKIVTDFGDAYCIQFSMQEMRDLLL